jgi:hypothetical protein
MKKRLGQYANTNPNQYRDNFRKVFSSIEYPTFHVIKHIQNYEKKTILLLFLFQ